jgi:transposase
VGRWRARRSELTASAQAFRGVLGASIDICKPADPEAKGMLERLHDYLERSFLPGRSFASPADFNVQLSGFLVKANARKMWLLGCTPGDRVAADREATLVLPPVPPEVGWRESLRSPRNHYVRLDSNDYSVHPAVVGRRIEVHADLARSGSPATARSWPTTPGSGPSTRPSPTSTTRSRASFCVRDAQTCARPMTVATSPRR